MKKLSIHALEYTGKLPRYGHAKAHLKPVSYVFEFGKSYLLNGSIGEGAVALNLIIGGVLKPSRGNILLDDVTVDQTDLRQLSWYVRQDEIRRWGLFPMTVREQLIHGIRKYRGSCLNTVDQIAAQFQLTSPRMERRLTQLSHESYRASSAIAVANGYRIVCYPHADTRPGLIDEYYDLWLKSNITALKACDILVLFPANAHNKALTLCDEIVEI